MSDFFVGSRLPDGWWVIDRGHAICLDCGTCFPSEDPYYHNVCDDCSDALEDWGLWLASNLDIQEGDHHG